MLAYYRVRMVPFKVSTDPSLVGARFCQSSWSLVSRTLMTPSSSPNMLTRAGSRLTRPDLHEVVNGPTSHLRELSASAD